MNGVKGFIEDAMPHSWTYILKKNRCYRSFIDQFYNGIAPMKNRNKYYYKISIQRARHELRCLKINAIAIGYQFKEGADFWNNIAIEISNYEFNCN